MAEEIKLTEFRDELISTSRAEKIKQLIARRQKLAIILENVHDPHNIGAVMRSCDAVGVGEVYLLYTEPIHDYHKREIGQNASSGARKWVQAHYYYDVDECFYAVRKKYERVLGTHLAADAVSLYDLNLVDPVALMFGNEHLGISTASLAQLDGNFVIPQFGMVQSLNISVACAVSLFESLRQRNQRGLYNSGFDPSDLNQKEMFETMVNRHFDHNQKR